MLSSARTVQDRSSKGAAGLSRAPLIVYVGRGVVLVCRWIRLSSSASPARLDAPLRRKPPTALLATLAVGLALAYLTKVGFPPKPDSRETVEPEVEARAAPSTLSRSWGWLPGLSVVAALGLLLVALADTAARVGAAAAELVFWIGLLLLFLPIAARLASPWCARRERIGLVSVLGVGLFLGRVFQSPLDFSFIDELQHLRTAMDIARTSHLFHPNPILPVSPFYPGLEIAVTSLASISGLPLFDAAVIVTGVARLVLVLALYLFFEEVGRSSQVAGVATALYMCNPSYLFLDATFVYESLALSFGALTLFALVLRGGHVGCGRREVVAVASLGVVATVVTHHVTSYALTAFLILWTVTPLLLARATRILRWPLWASVAAWRRRGSAAASATLASDLVRDFREPWAHIESPGVVLLALALTLSWLVSIATVTIDYLGPNISGTLTQIMLLVAGDGNVRDLFHSYTGHLTPLWEQAIMSASVVLTVAGLPFALVRLWRSYRRSLAAIALGVVALGFPASMALRLMPLGVNIAGRAVTFVYVGVAFVFAVALAGHFCRGACSARKTTALMLLVSVLFVGDAVLNWAPESRMPGPYLVNSHTRSVEPQGISAADWMETFLGPGNRIATDFMNQLIMGSYGNQYPVTAAVSGFDLSQVFFSPGVGRNERALLRSAGIGYVIVDHRLSTQLPIVGFYYEGVEAEAFHHDLPMSPAVLAKFDNCPGVSRVFDSGDIEIYDVGTLSNAR